MFFPSSPCRTFNSLQQMCVGSPQMLLDRADGNSELACNGGVWEILEVIENPDISRAFGQLVQSRDELLNRLVPQQGAFRRVCFARATMHFFLIGFVGLRRARSQPSLPITQQVGRRLEEIRL